MCNEKMNSRRRGLKRLFQYFANELLTRKRYIENQEDWRNKGTLLRKINNTKEKMLKIDEILKLSYVAALYRSKLRFEELLRLSYLKRRWNSIYGCAFLVIMKRYCYCSLSRLVYVY